MRDSDARIAALVFSNVIFPSLVYSVNQAASLDRPVSAIRSRYINRRPISPATTFVI